MQIRSAKLSDLRELVTASKSWFDQMSFHHNANFYDLLTVIKRWRIPLENPESHDVVVAREDGRIIGCCGVGYKLEHNWHKGSLQAYEYVWHADPELSPIKRGKVMIALVDEIIRRFRIRGAVALHIAISLEFPAVERLLIKRGFSYGTQMMVLKGDSKWAIR